MAVRILGDLERLAPGARQAVDRVMAETAGGRDLALNLCISYSARAEITRAARLLAEDVAAGRLDPARSTRTRSAGGSTPLLGPTPIS